MEQVLKCIRSDEYEWISKIKSHHLGLFLGNVPQGQNGINVNSVRQTRSSTTKARQELHEWLKAGRMSGITQNFESDNQFLYFTSGNSLDGKFMERLWEEQIKIHVTMFRLNLSHIKQIYG